VAGRRVAGERFAFDEDVWAEEVDRFRLGGAANRSAVSARAQIERSGARIPVRPCEQQGRDGSRLAGCAKVYVPIGAEPSRAPYGFVFVLRTGQGSGMVVLRLIAFGERHPPPGVRSVYERAHRRLHGRYPDQ